MSDSSSQPDLGPDTEPDLGPDTEPDVQSDPALAEGQGDDGNWSDEGGATPTGPATATDDD